MTSLAQVAGQNARAIRLDAYAQLQDVAGALRRYGLRWSTGRVGDFEGGRVSPTLPTLLAVAAALTDLTGKTVTLADLFTGTGPVQVNRDLEMALASVRHALHGKPVAAKSGKASGPEGDFVEADERICKQLNVTTEVGYKAMLKLWGRTFRAERDHRAGPHANQQRRGIVARQLKAELREAIG